MVSIRYMLHYMHDSRYLIFAHHEDEPTQENAIIYIHHCIYIIVIFAKIEIPEGLTTIVHNNLWASYIDITSKFQSNFALKMQSK